MLLHSYKFPPCPRPNGLTVSFSTCLHNRDRSLMTQPLTQGPNILDRGAPSLPLSEYLALPRDKQIWVLEGILPQSGKMLIFSPPKLGKSSLAIQLAQAVSGATPDWMGFPVRTVGKVLYIQLDTPPSTWADRFRRLQAHGLNFNDNIIIADETSIGNYVYPLDVLQPAHVTFLCQVMQNPALHPDGKLWVHTRLRARELARMIPGKTEDGCLSSLRRASSRHRASSRLTAQKPLAIIP